MDNKKRIKILLCSLLAGFFSNPSYVAWAGSDAGDVASFPAAIATNDKLNFLWEWNWKFFKYNFTGAATPLGGSSQYTEASSHQMIYLPGFFLSTPLKKNFYFGLALYKPSSLSDSTIYSEASLIRYNFTQATYNTWTYSPILAYKFNNMFMVGVGPDINHTQVDFGTNIAVNSSLNLQTDARSQTTTEGFGYGAHGSILINIPKTFTRIEAGYRTRSTIHTNGTTTLTNPPQFGGGIFTTGNFFSDIPLPARFRGRILQPLSKKFILAGLVEYTWWDVLKQLGFNNVLTPGIPREVNTTLNLEWQNQFRYGGGFLYQFVKPVNLLFTNYLVRSTNLNLDGENYFIYSANGFYKFNEHLGMNLYYEHHFKNSYPLVNVTGSQFVSLGGSTTNSQDQIGVSLSVTV